VVESALVADPGPVNRAHVRAIVAGLLAILLAAGCGASPDALRPPIPQGVAIERAMAQIDTTSNYCRFSTCPSIVPRQVQIVSATLDPARRHRIPDSPVAALLERDPDAQVWAVVLGMAGFRPEHNRMIFLVDARSGELLFSTEFDETYWDLVVEP
jgi:hypothetical protein